MSAPLTTFDEPSREDTALRAARDLLADVARMPAGWEYTPEQKAQIRWAKRTVAAEGRRRAVSKTTKRRKRATKAAKRANR